MDRLKNLRSEFVSAAESSEEENLSQGAQGGILDLPQGPEHQGTRQIIQEIERQKLIKKKRQSLEDTERCMQDYKAKGNLNIKSFESYVLGEIFQYGQKYIDFMKNDPDYSLTEIEQETKDEQRRLTNLLIFKIFKNFPVSARDYKERPWDLTALFTLVGLTQRSVTTKLGVQFFLYAKSLLVLGTEKHQAAFERAISLKDMGSFCLTELTHGSNVQGCITNAVFDEKRKSFVLYTPHERGIKFWIGNAAHTANMAVVGANLIVKNKNYGMHFFLVEIRDRVTHNLKPGVSCGDCGQKMGLNGVDNGFIAFRGLRVSRDALLNRVTNVDEEGNVTSIFEKKDKRFAVQLSALSEGRTKVGTVSCVVGLKACCIATRFATVRRQFGKGQYDEISIIDYPSMRNRLFPLIANSLIPLFAARKINNIWFQNGHLMFEPKSKEVQEMHALISSIKPLCTEWLHQTMEETRKSMGGLGFSSHAEIPRMYNDVHVMSTWEGENYVLIQQVSKFIVSGLKKTMETGESSVFKSLSYLSQDGLEDSRVQFTSPQDFENLDNLEMIMRMRAKISAFEAFSTLGGKIALGEEPFDAWNKSLPFDLDSAARYYGELFIFDVAKKAVINCPEPENKEFLAQLLTIFALNRIKESFSLTAENLDFSQLKLINELLLQLYEKIRFNAVLCFDGLLMEDELVRSPLGTKSGNVYEGFLATLISERDNFGKAPYWKEIVKARNGSRFDLA